MKKKKVLIIIIISLLLILSIVGISYALWTLNLTQTGENDIATTCFNISFTEKDNISLQKSYPLHDKDGKKLTPYEFTITNNCDSYASYNVNLEVLNTTTLTNNEAIKVMFSKKEDGAESELKLDLLSNYETVTKTLNNATSAFKLVTGYLGPNESKTYDLRVWLDENVTTETVTSGLEEGAIKFGNTTWANEKANVTISTESSYRLQYQIDGIEEGNWTEIQSGQAVTGLSLGQTVYARLWDGTNGGNTASLNVQDATNPNEATITLSKQTAMKGEKITAEVSQSDNESGVDITKCRWIYNQTSTKLGEDETNYTGKFTSANETISLIATSSGDYYLHVLTVDRAGNKTEKTGN